MTSYYTSTLTDSNTTGFHPVLTISIHLRPKSEEDNKACSLWTFLALSPAWILDRYQLGQLHREGRLGSYDPSSTTFLVVGEHDLEGPVTHAKSVQALLKLSSSDDEKEKVLNVDIPLHLRYQTPVIERYQNDERTGERKRMDSVEVKMNVPQVFWRCSERISDDGSRPICPPSEGLSAFLLGSSRANSSSLSSSPESLSFSYHFLPQSPTPTTSFKTCSTPPPAHYLSTTIPTGVQTDLPIIDVVNFLIIWSGMVWLLYTSYKAKTASKILDGSKKID